MPKMAADRMDGVEDLLQQRLQILNTKCFQVNVMSIALLVKL
jgi:hypothetical protein